MTQRRGLVRVLCGYIGRPGLLALLLSCAGTVAAETPFVTPASATMPTPAKPGQLETRPTPLLRPDEASRLVQAPGSQAELAPTPLMTAAPAAMPRVLSLPAALDWALRNNPDLAALRQRRGIAAAGVVIAQTYPFNPISENRIQVASGPFSAGITNFVPLENLLLWEVEVRGQGRYRRGQAAAALSRTEWEIAFQEHTLSIFVIRAFQTVVYQQEKLKLAEDTVRLNEDLLKSVQRLFRGGRLGAADRIVAESELQDSRAALEVSKAALLKARVDLRRLLGVVDESFTIDGALEATLPYWGAPALTEAALALRADLRARRAAVAEAEARVQLEVANRYGNPTIGPAFTYDNSRVSEGGVQVNFPLPVCNTRRGEIQQRQYELAQAAQELRATEVLIRQDVQAALARLDLARSRAENYRTQLLPSLRTGLQDIERLFEAGTPGVGVLQVIDVRRKLLRARDGNLDALLELAQALADLAAAAGEPALAVHPHDVLPSLPAVLQPPSQ
jgi:cobalt-zinc-cadmium efflux system outer membrane protein